MPTYRSRTTTHGRNMAGARVPTGVYYIMCATQDGSKGIAAKVVVI